MFFNKKYTLEDSGILQGMTDWHCHLLPGVDDGFKTLDDTLKALDEFERLGIVNVWFTPHVMEDIPNTTAGLRERFDEVCNAYNGSLTLNLAAEYMLDTLFEERLANNDLLTLGTEGKHLLVETSYFAPPVNMDEIIYKIKSAGYHPVLAHPERYTYMDMKEYIRRVKEGVILQSNIFSLTGFYGETARKKVTELLKTAMPDAALTPLRPDGVTVSSMVSLTGTDLHSLKQLEHNLKSKELSKQQIAHIDAIPRQ